MRIFNFYCEKYEAKKYNVNCAIAVIFWKLYDLFDLLP